MEPISRRAIFEAGGTGVVTALAAVASAGVVPATAAAAAASADPPVRPMVPVPGSISPQAQQALRQQMAGANPIPFPAPQDIESWRQRIRRQDALLAGVFAGVPAFAGRTETRMLGGVPLYVATPERARPGVAYLEIHGGALVFGSGEFCRRSGELLAQKLGAQVWSIDYRMPPDHPYPVPLEDCLAAYDHLLVGFAAHRIVVGGGSAGGNLAAALMLRARDAGRTLPAAVVLQTPELDLTESGDSFAANLGVDTVLTQRLINANRLYAGGHDLSHPYLSPLFGDFTKGFPPSFLSVGTRDLFLSNGARMQRALRRAGVQVELFLGEAMPHGGFPGSPENAELDQEVRQFVHAAWDRRA